MDELYLDHISVGGVSYPIRDAEAEANAAQRDGYYEGADLTVRFADEIAASPYSGDAWAWIRARILTGNFRGIHVGDWIPFTANGNTYNAQVAGINTYKGYGDSGYVVGNHIDFVADKLWDSLHVWNLVDYNNGPSNSYRGPWVSSELYYWLNGRSGAAVTGYSNNAPVVGTITYSDSPSAPAETRGLIGYLPAALRSVIAEKRMSLPDRYASTPNQTDNTGISWRDAGKLWVPTEVEVTGSPIWAVGAYATAGGYIKYPLFSHTENRLKKRAGTEANAMWWLMDPINANKQETGSLAGANYKRVTVVMADGRTSPGETSNTGIGVPICFRIA